MKSGTFSEISAGTVTSDRSLRSERLQPRLAPAPPRLGLERMIPEPVYWEPVHDLDNLVDELAAIEPLEPDHTESAQSELLADESLTAASSDVEDPNSAREAGVSE